MSRRKEQTNVPPPEATLNPSLALLMMAKSDYDANGFYANAPYRLFTPQGEFIGKIEEGSDYPDGLSGKRVTKTRLVVIRPAAVVDYQIVENENNEKRMLRNCQKERKDQWLYEAIMDEKRKNG